MIEGLIQLLIAMTNITSKIHTKHYRFQSSNPLLLSICILSISCFVHLHWNWSFLSILLQPHRSIKFDHVKPSLVHDFFYIQNIEMIPLVQFKDVIFLDVYKICKNKSQKMWYSLTQESFFDYMYKVRFSPDFSIWIFQLFRLRHVSYKNISSWCNMKVFTRYSNLVWTS